MKPNEIISELNSHFKMVGLSSDWIYRTWLLSGDEMRGLVFFENEDDSTYELVEFCFFDEKREETLLFSGSLNEAFEFYLRLQKI
ncbi:hypothetical protein [Aeromonas veronii]|uniref:hypothetical protein n=1 Tax=Aeromonas veronii TaxID=654 RepID=UPI003D253770